MKKRWLIPVILVGLLVLDLSWVAVFERPLFALKEDCGCSDQKYIGVFYDVIDCLESETKILPKGSKYACPVSSVTEFVPMIMVDGELYMETGIWHEDAKCGVMDGEITSYVTADQKPFKDNQANFTGVSGYQFGEDGTIEVNLDGKWFIFATEEKVQQFEKDYADYPKTSELKKVEGVDMATLVRVGGMLYAQSYALVDVEVTKDADGIIDVLVPVDVVPMKHGQTNQKSLLNAAYYLEGDDETLLLLVDRVFYLFERIE